MIIQPDKPPLLHTDLHTDASLTQVTLHVSGSVGEVRQATSGACRRTGSQRAPWPTQVGRTCVCPACVMHLLLTPVNPQPYSRQRSITPRFSSMRCCGWVVLARACWRTNIPACCMCPPADPPKTQPARPRRDPEKNKVIQVGSCPATTCTCTLRCRLAIPRTAGSNRPTRCCSPNLRVANSCRRRLHSPAG